VSITRRSPSPRLRLALGGGLLALGLALGTAAPAAAAEPTPAPVPDPLSIQNVVEFDGELYVAHVGGDDEDGLYRFDGTSFTYIPGTPVYTTGYVEFDGDLFFTGYDALADLWLWRFDGTTATPVASAGDVYTALFNGDLYFVAPSGQLAVFDGGVAATVLGSPGSVRQLFPVGSELYFTAGPTSTLWSMDTSLMFTDYLTAYSLSAPDSVQDFAVFDGMLYFAANDGTDWGLWRDTGATLEEVRSYDLYSDLFVLDGVLYVSGNGPDGIGLLSFDGASEEPVAGAPDGAFGGQVGPEGVGYVLGYAPGGAYPVLYSFDGTDFVEFPGAYFGGQDYGDLGFGFALLDGVLYFTADAEGGDESLELWVLALDPDAAPGGELAETGADPLALAASAFGLALVGAGALAARSIRAGGGTTGGRRGGAGGGLAR